MYFMRNVNGGVHNVLYRSNNRIRKRVANSVDLSDIHALLFGTQQDENGRFIR